MAESPSHKFGQIIGNLLEDLVEPYLAEFAGIKNLYLDSQKKSRPARKGKKVTWEDDYGVTGRFKVGHLWSVQSRPPLGV